MEKTDRIKKEEKRLYTLYKDVQDNKKKVIDGLIQRAAYMRVTLEDYESDLDKNGYIESFTQSTKTAPYERERPVARLYNTMNKNYQSIVKMLADMLPKEDASLKDDGFDSFSNQER